MMHKKESFGHVLSRNHVSAKSEESLGNKTRKQGGGCRGETGSDNFFL